MEPSGIRKRTRRAIYDFIRAEGQATKNEIAAALGISLPIVSKYLNHFIRDGLLAKGEKLSSTANGGRRPVAYTCVPDGRIAIGVDITQTRVRTVLVDLERHVLRSRRTQREFERSPEYFAFVGQEVEALLEDVDRAHLLGVGVAVPGLISETTQEVTFGRVIDNAGVSVADFARHIPFHTRLVHDSDAAGLAEFWGEYGLRNAFYISLSNSVGGSVLIKDEIYRGDGEFAGEIGHLTLHPGGKRCYCGQLGCMDAYCNSGLLADQADGTVEQFFEKLAEGDAVAAEVWEEYTSNLARALHNIRVLFGCPIILGGDVGAQLGDQLDGLAAKVDKLSFLTSRSADFLLPCSYTTQPVATGAALYLVSEFHQEIGPVSPGGSQSVPLA
jgi:predicted NBD/HSP70 family sugar kinase